MLSLRAPVNLCTSVALLPAGKSSLNETLVVCVSALYSISGDEATDLEPVRISVEWILRSSVLRDMEFVSSTTSRLKSSQ
jgi:hypothetical protein